MIKISFQANINKNYFYFYYKPLFSGKNSMEIEKVYRKCPNCGQWHNEIEFLSYSFMGNETVWSDGKVDEVGFPLYIAFIKCAKCQHFFWKEDCDYLEELTIQKYLKIKQGGSTEGLNKSGLSVEMIQLIKEILNGSTNLDEIDYPDAVYPNENYHNDAWDELIISDLLKLLQESYDDKPDREIHLRELLWITLNDLYRTSVSDHNSFRYFWNWQWIKNLFDFEYRRRDKRYKKEAHIKFYSYQKIYENNLNRLRFLFKDTDVNDEERAFRQIELLRCLGEFGDALSAIDKLKLREEPVFIKKTRKKIARRDEKVFVV